MRVRDRLKKHNGITVEYTRGEVVLRMDGHGFPLDQANRERLMNELRVASMKAVWEQKGEHEP